jgi:hypothetical protein
MAFIVTDNGATAAAAATEVVVLRDDNFEQMTQASSTGQMTGKWFVQFYASWCGHCKSLSPKWEELSNELEDDDNRQRREWNGCCHCQIRCRAQYRNQRTVWSDWISNPLIFCR